MNVHPIYHQCHRKHAISCKKDKNFLKNYPKIFLLRIYSIVVQIIYDNLHQNFLTQSLYVLMFYNIEGYTDTVLFVMHTQLQNCVHRGMARRHLL